MAEKSNSKSPFILSVLLVAISYVLASYVSVKIFNVWVGNDADRYVAIFTGTQAFVTGLAIFLVSFYLLEIASNTDKTLEKQTRVHDDTKEINRVRVNDEIYNKRIKVLNEFTYIVYRLYVINASFFGLAWGREKLINGRDIKAIPLIMEQCEKDISSYFSDIKQEMNSASRALAHIAADGYLNDYFECQYMPEDESKKASEDRRKPHKKFFKRRYMPEDKSNKTPEDRRKPHKKFSEETVEILMEKKPEGVPDDQLNNFISGMQTSKPLVERLSSFDINWVGRSYQDIKDYVKTPDDILSFFKKFNNEFIVNFTGSFTYTLLHVVYVYIYNNSDAIQSDLVYELKLDPSRHNVNREVLIFPGYSGIMDDFFLPIVRRDIN